MRFYLKKKREKHILLRVSFIDCLPTAAQVSTPRCQPYSGWGNKGPVNIARIWKVTLLFGHPPSIALSLPLSNSPLFFSLSLSCFLSLFLCLSPPLHFSPSISLLLSLSLYFSLSSSTSLPLYISVPLSLSLYLYPSISLPLCLSLPLYISLPISLSLYLYSSISPPFIIFSSISLPFISLSLYISTSIFLSLFLYLSPPLYLYPSISFPLYLSLYFSLSLSVSLSPSISISLYHFRRYGLSQSTDGDETSSKKMTDAEKQKEQRNAEEEEVRSSLLFSIVLHLLIKPFSIKRLLSYKYFLLLISINFR